MCWHPSIASKASAEGHQLRLVGGEGGGVSHATMGAGGGPHPQVMGGGGIAGEDAESRGGGARCQRCGSRGGGHLGSGGGGADGGRCGACASRTAPRTEGLRQRRRRDGRRNTGGKDNFGPHEGGNAMPKNHRGGINRQGRKAAIGGGGGPPAAREQDGAEGVVSLRSESNFPSLAIESRSDGDLLHVFDISPANRFPDDWLEVASKAELRIREEEGKARLMTERVEGKCGLTLLTTLGRRDVSGDWKKSGDISADPNSHVDRRRTRGEDGKDVDVTAYLQEKGLACGNRFDIGRMRDRWWSVLKQKKVKDEATAELARRRAETLRVEEEACLTNSSSCQSSIASNSDINTGTDIDLDNESDYGCGVQTALQIRDNGCHCPLTLIQVQGNNRQRHSVEDPSLVPYIDEKYPLHAAICQGNAAIVTKLLALLPDLVGANAVISTVSQYLKTRNEILLPHDDMKGLKVLSPLFLATFLDQPNLIKAMLDSNSPPSVNSMDEQHRTPLIAAAQCGHDGCVKVIFSYGPRLDAKEHTADDTALHACCRGRGQPSTLRLLLGAAKRGVGSRRLICARDRDGCTALHVACGAGRTDLVEAFLSYSAVSAAVRLGLNTVDGKGNTPLLAAVEADAVDCAVALVMWRGNDLTKRSWGVSPKGSNGFGSRCHS